MHVQQIEVFQLHQFQGLFNLFLNGLMFRIHNFRRDKQLLSFYSALADDCLYGFPQRDLIIVVPSSIDVLTISELQSFSEQFSEDELVGDIISA